MKKQVTVTYTNELLRGYFRYVFDKNGKRTKTVFICSAAGFCVFLALSVIFYDLGTKVGNVSVFHVCVSGCAVCAAVAAVYALSMKLYPRLSAKKMSRSVGKTVVYDFGENTFSASLPDGRGKKSYPYRVMHGFAVSKGYIFLYGNSSSAFILPFDAEIAGFLSSKLKKL
ncbi:MAG: hypothetical protein SOZ93_05140 [Eubacteriales bacterium]|nr:hypothetical protein [Clostridiales bacterium]MDD6340978.1 hypothetical protein [Eubacteriales bacterium]MDY3760686.1 hypothetical protein [Eubacteriales bacterium]